MSYQKNTENGYLVSLVGGIENGNITEAEYSAILSVIHNKPTAPTGYDYRLRDDLTWEQYALPAVTTEEDAEAADYQAELLRLGVNL